MRDFYSAVTGWQPQPVAMGEYSDYSMADGDGKAVAGVCHKRGTNAGIPSQWLIYIVVENLDESMATCRDKGGEIVTGPSNVGEARFCVIRDPAGAVAALYQP